MFAMIRFLQLADVVMHEIMNAVTVVLSIDTKIFQSYGYSEQNLDDPEDKESD